jgi:hypothetical protein
MATGGKLPAFGRLIFLERPYPKENYRLHTFIPRDSLFWQLHRDARSCAERSVKRKKCDFHLRETRTAGRARWFFLPRVGSCFVPFPRGLV